MRRGCTALCFLLCVSMPSTAHYNMLLPDKPWAEKGDKVTFTYQYGHPFEHELADAPRPEGLMVVRPNGEKEMLDVEKILTQIKKDGADGKKVAAWQFTYTPAERGDYTLVLKTPPIKHDVDKFVQDFVRVALHVQTQNGWDGARRAFSSEMLVRPYTRPYGLLPGMLFRGRVVFVDAAGFEIVGIEYPVEIEKYNAVAPKKLPPDELITFTAKTDRQGHFATTLPDAGWCGITGLEQSAQKRAGKLVQWRTTHWIHVDEKK